MTPATKQQAQIKLKVITNKIGYPDKWRDYSSVAIKRDDAMGNAVRADDFEFQRRLNKIGKPVDRGEWSMSPPTVNAYYDPLMNNINFPAGILQPPFYDKQMDPAVNFGGIGTVMGHELTYGFDDQGRKFDAQGNLRDWWTPADAKAFDERAACFAEQYSNVSRVPGVYLNGNAILRFQFETVPLCDRVLSTLIHTETKHEAHLDQDRRGTRTRVVRAAAHPTSVLQGDSGGDRNG